MGYNAKITSKGQITVPAGLRAHMGVGEGDHLAFEIDADGTVRMRKASRSLQDIKGMVKYKGPPLTSDDLVEIVHRTRAEVADHRWRHLDETGE